MMRDISNSWIYTSSKINELWVSKFLSQDVCIFKCVSCFTVTTVPSSFHACPFAKQCDTKSALGWAAPTSLNFMDLNSQQNGH